MQKYSCVRAAIYLSQRSEGTLFTVQESPKNSPLCLDLSLQALSFKKQSIL